MKHQFWREYDPSQDKGWKLLAEHARVYLEAGAWQSAHDILWPHVSPLVVSKVVPPAAAECLCLLLGACWRLQHGEHLANGEDLLIRLVPQHQTQSAETRVLIAHSLSRRDANRGDYVTARTRLVGISPDTIDRAHPWTQARLALLLGRIELREGRTDKAEQSGLRAARLSAISASGSTQGDALSLLATVAKARGRPTDANQLYAKAGMHYWQAANMTGHALVILNRAWTLNRIGLLREAAQLFQEARDAALSLGREETALRARLGLGWVSARKGDLASARSRLLSAWRAARRLRMPREEALALEYLAETYILADSLPKARLAVRLCSRWAVSNAFEGDIALEIAVREGMLCLAEQNTRDALSCARKAIKHGNRAEMIWEQAHAYRVLGMAQLQASRKREARAAFKKALELLKTMGERLESYVVEEWLQVLDQRAARRRRLSSETTPGLPAAVCMDATHPGGSIRPENEPLSDTVRYWLEHPLLGPIGWFRQSARRKRTRRVSVVQALDTSHLHDPQFRSAPNSGIASPKEDADTGPSERRVHPIWSELGLVTRTPEVLKTLRVTETYAPGLVPVLILGETGTGKDLIAQGIHALSEQAGRLVPVNCAAARKELFVADLFGARRGAYTGAIESRRGLIEEAEGGTIFFDEIADLEPQAQGYLLRFLDTGEVRPLGETKSRHVKTRVVAATCRDLPQHVQAGLFRADLYGRLAGLILRIPPLCQRADDLDLLIEVLWRREDASANECNDVFRRTVLSALRRRPWPGNVRELMHVVSRAVLYSRTHGAAAARADVLQSSSEIAMPIVDHPTGYDSRGIPKDASKSKLVDRGASPANNSQDDWDHDLLRKKLDEAGGYIPKAAELLGLSRSHAYRLYKRLKLADTTDSPDTSESS
ncbi:sigma 54-interacting transcriptional regulator [Candidatus Eisenbacteria bacterium]|uniref:Sigma 54-interacting transcriptional regulator n=1 Tax=Eiseniibacteriota bacterium TaxID=2212470 RepID=A0ABV6YLK7_UNCEI